MQRLNQAYESGQIDRTEYLANMQMLQQQQAGQRALSNALITNSLNNMQQQNRPLYPGYPVYVAPVPRGGNGYYPELFNLR